MWNEPSQERLDRVPRLYETDSHETKDKPVHLHFFIGGCDWYISEYDGEDIFFGYAIINQDYNNAEWGYVSFSELKSLNLGGLEIDCENETSFPVQTAKDIENIKLGGGVW